MANISKSKNSINSEIILVLITAILSSFYFMYISAGVGNEIAIIYTALLIFIGYIFWTFLFTDEGIYIYHKVLKSFLEEASFPTTFRIVIVCVFSFSSIAIGLIFLVIGSDSHDFSYTLIVMAISIIVGLLSWLSVPNYGKSVYRKNKYLVINATKIMLPLLTFPFVLLPGLIWYWGIFIVTYSFIFFIGQINIILRHLAINYFLNHLAIPSKPGESDIRPIELCINESKFRKYGFQPKNFCNFSTKGYRQIAKGLGRNAYHVLIKRDPLSLPVFVLRDKFRIWYSERKYNKIIETGELYLQQYFADRDFSNMSHVISQIYFRSLLRTGNSEQKLERLFNQYDKTSIKYNLSIEKAYWLWDNEDTDSAILTIRETVQALPTFTAAKNCLVFYLCDSAIDEIYEYGVEHDIKFTDCIEIAQEKLKEAKDLLNDIKRETDIIDPNSYFWSNQGYYELITGNTSAAESHYELSMKNIRAKENVRSRIGLGLISLSKNHSVNNALFHFERANLGVSSNTNSRYYKISSALTNYVYIFRNLHVFPNTNFIYCVNAVHKYPQIWNTKDPSVEKIKTVTSKYVF